MTESTTTASAPISAIPGASTQSGGSGESGATDAATVSRRNRTALILLLVAVFVVFLNETLMSVAVPDIMKDLGITPSQGQWLTTAFALTMAVVIPITGWLLQRIDTRPVFVVAMSLFVAGTLVAAVAPGFGMLVLGRVIQASGTAIMMPLMFTTVLEVVPPRDRGRMMGRISIVMSVAPAIGPTVSGLVLSVLPWRALFWLVLPIAVAMLVVGIALVPNVGAPRRIRLDVLSVILSAFAFSGLVFGLSQIGASVEGKAISPAWIPLVVGVLALGGLIARQLVLQRSDQAFLDLRVFRSVPYTQATIVLAVSMVALFGTVLILPIYMQNVLHQKPLIVGLVLLPGGLLMGLLGPLVGNLYDRFGPRPLMVPGSLAVCAAFWGLTMLTPTSSVLWVLAANVLLSLGLAFLFTPVFTLGTSKLSPNLYSHGSAIISTTQQVAGAAGTAMFIAFLALGTAAAGAADAEHASAVERGAGVHLAFLVGAIVSVVPVIVSAFIRRPVLDDDGDAPTPPIH